MDLITAVALILSILLLGYLAGVMTGRIRWILAISVTLAVIAGIVVYAIYV